MVVLIESLQCDRYLELITVIFCQLSSDVRRISYIIKSPNSLDIHLIRFCNYTIIMSKITFSRHLLCTLSAFLKQKKGYLATAISLKMPSVFKHLCDLKKRIEYLVKE